MFARTKSGLLVAVVVTGFFITSLVVGLPFEGSPDSISVAAAQEVTLSQLLVNPVESDPGFELLATNPELMVHGRYVAPVVENEAVTSERLLAYLRWKHNAGSPFPEEEAHASNQLLEYLRWKHNADPGVDNYAQASEPTVSQPAMGKAQLQNYLHWAHLRGD